MYYESVTNFLEKGGSITVEELGLYIRDIEKAARIDAIEKYKKFLLQRMRQGKCVRVRRHDHEFGQIILDTNEYLYKLRRLRNGQELEGDPEEQGDTSDKRFKGKEKIKV